MYTLHNSQGQLSGVQDLIEFLNCARLVQLLSPSGTMIFQTMGPKLRKDRSPFLTESTCGRTKLSPDLVPILLPLWIKSSFINGGDKSCLTLPNSCLKLQNYLSLEDLQKKLGNKSQSPFMYMIDFLIHSARAKHPNKRTI